MRKFILKYSLIISIVFFGISTGLAQDLPLFTQKLTNSFLYNPSVAGNGKGSLTLSNRSFWNNVPGAPRSNFLSFHLPFGYHKFGAGANFMQETIGVYNSMYLTGAFAYHLKFTDDMVLSMGVSSEFTSLGLNQNRIDVVHSEDPLLVNFNTRNSIDFSFGLSFKTPYFDLGLSSNRLATALGIADFETQISQFYTGYVFGKIPLSEEHLVEPMFAYRRLTDQSAQWDVGAYYSYRKAITLGASYRQTGILSPSVGLTFKDKLTLGYTFEMFGKGLQKDIGATNEITLRLDLRDDAYSRNVRNSGAVMKNSVAFRRKTMSPTRFRSKPLSASSSKYKKKVKRNYSKSPNFRMNSSKKLATAKRSNSLKKSSYGKKKSLSKRGKSTYSKKRKPARFKPQQKKKKSSKRRR